jgi:hypothetical protein
MLVKGKKSTCRNEVYCTPFGTRVNTLTYEKPLSCRSRHDNGADNLNENNNLAASGLGCGVALPALAHPLLYREAAIIQPGGY